jgi:hypothetical protein
MLKEAEHQEDSFDTWDTERQKFENAKKQTNELTETRLSIQKKAYEARYGKQTSNKDTSKKGKAPRTPLKKKDFVLNEAEEDNRPDDEIEAEEEGGDLMAVLRKKREAAHARSNQTARGGKICSARGNGRGKGKINASRPDKPSPSKSVQTQTPAPPIVPDPAIKPTGNDNEFHETFDSETAAGQFIDSTERNYGVESEELDIEDSEDLLDLSFDEDDTAKVAKDLFDLSFQN